MENFIQKICRMLTKHCFRYCYAYWEKDGERPEYYCRCQLCHYHFWTDKRPKKLPKGE